MKEKKNKPDLFPPVGKKASSYSTPLSGSGGAASRGPALTTPPRSQELVGTIPEEDVPLTTPPAMPTKCPKCLNHLKESNVCSYCATTSRPHPVPRKRRSIKTEIQPARQPINSPPAPLIPPRNNSGPIARDNPPSVPSVIPYINDSEPHNNNVPPQSNNSGPRDNMAPYINNSGPRISSGSIHPNTENESPATLVAEDKEPSDSLHSTLRGDALLINEGQSDVHNQQYLKYNMEAEHFANLSQDQQDVFLEKKVNFSESVTHLQVYYKGRNWYGTKDQKEIESFVKLDPLQQEDLIVRKRMKQEKIAHLAPYYNATCDSQRQLEEEKRKRQEKQDKAKMEGRLLCQWIKVSTDQCTNRLIVY